MNIFQKLLNKIKTRKQKSKDSECWYNNFHDQEKGLVFNCESADFAGPSSCELTCTKSIARK